MQRLVDGFSELGQGQVVRVTLDDGETIEARVSQIEYSPNERLRIELTGEDSRYQVRAHADGDTWAPVEIHRFDPHGDGWSMLPGVSSMTPAETFRTVKSADMEAQEDTGTR